MTPRRLELGFALVGLCGCGTPSEATTGTDASSGGAATSMGQSTGADTTTSADATTAQSQSDSAQTSTPMTTGPASSSSGRTSTESGDTETIAPPFVLAHGFFGFNDFAGAGFVDYFWDVRETLEANGDVLVFTPAVDPFNDSTTRGEQLLEEVERILAETGAERVNLVGHSQGGLDARVVAFLRPELVESVTTIATPHQGSPIADGVLALVPPGASAQAISDALLQFFGGALWGEIDADSSLIDSMRQFSEGGITTFNLDYPDVRDLPYYSIAGRSGRHRGGEDCDAPAAPEFVRKYDELRDPIDPLFALAEAAIDGSILNPIPNDGLVRVADAKRGEFWGCIPADHVDQIGHLFGDGPGFGNDFDHLVFYEDLVAHLRALGH